MTAHQLTIIGTAMFRKQFFSLSTFEPVTTLMSSSATRPEMAAVVVAIAGTILPAISLV